MYEGIVVGPIRLIAAALVFATVALPACNPARKQECDKFLAAMKPLDEGTPSVDAVERVQKDVEGLNLQGQPLRIYATNYQNTLAVLAGTLRLQAGPSAPDGTDDVIKTHLREARTDHEDVRRYCDQ